MSKARYWVGVCYPENMIYGWETEIGDILQYPYAYCIHDKDIDSQSDTRKNHVHIIIAFPNTTTDKHALKIINMLSMKDRICCPMVQNVVSIRGAYEYLIHNTETCIKKGKYLYDNNCRITGNNFDIGNYEQLGIHDKNRMAKELADFIRDEKIVNFMDFYDIVMDKFSIEYFEIVKSYSGLYERLCKGNFLKYMSR